MLTRAEALEIVSGFIADVNSNKDADQQVAVCDERTIAPDDLIALDLVYRDRRGEIYAAAYNPGHRWFYFPDMQLDEALLIKCYDARRDVARFVIHSAFEDPTSPIDAPFRESIEYRTIAFF